MKGNVIQILKYFRYPAGAENGSFGYCICIPDPNSCRGEIHRMEWPVNHGTKDSPVENMESGSECGDNRVWETLVALSNIEPVGGTWVPASL